MWHSICETRSSVSSRILIAISAGFLLSKCLDRKDSRLAVFSTSAKHSVSRAFDFRQGDRPLSYLVFDSILQEQRKFEPSEEFRRNAHIKSAEEYERIYRESVEQPEKFPAVRIVPPVCTGSKSGTRSSIPPRSGLSVGEINLSYNCLYSHVHTARKNKAAIIWESEPGEVRTLTYQQLHREVQKFANVLKSLGVKSGRLLSPSTWA